MLLSSAACSAGTSTLPVTTKVASTSATAGSDQLKLPDIGSCTMPQGTRSAKDTCKQCPNGTYADVCAPVQAPPPINPVTCAFYCGGDGNPSGTICPKGTQYDPDSDSCVKKVAHSNGPAQYNDQCTRDAEFVGHDVPAHTGMASSITNEYPVSVGGGALIGYVYTTYGTNGNNGTAYFVAISSAVGALVTIGTDVSIPVGPNSFVQGSNFGSVLNVITQVVTAGRAPHMGGACYTSNWDGTYGA